MKYIRTKDGEIGIFRKAGDRNNNNEDYIAFKTFSCSIKYLEEYDKDYKQADTIEELCDEYVVIYNESKKFTKPFTSAYSDIKDVLKEHDINECKVYGAIWTDKGLIYVAKMNDEGKLELL